MRLPRLKEFSRLLRIEYLGFSCVCVIGALSAVGRELTIADGILLFLINMCSISWGFVHNDYCDIGYDSGSETLKGRPLVKGSITPGEALLVIGVCLVIVVALATLFYGRPLPLIILFLSMPLAAIYNRYSKKLAGSDFFFAASAALLCLFGATAVSVTTNAIIDISKLVWVLVAIEFVDHLFFNIAGGLKDLEIDRNSGARTTPLIMGITVAKDRTITIPARFKILMMTIKLLTVALVFLPFLFFALPFHPIQMLLLAGTAVLALYNTWKLLGIEVFDRRKVAYQIVRQENACKALVPLMLVSYIGIYWFLFFLIAPLWFIFFNSLLNNMAFAPPKTF